MKNTEKIAEELFDKIRSRFDHVVLGDENTNETDEPEKARFINFDYTSSTGKNYGNITVSLIDENSLKIYFSQDLANLLDETPQDQKEWYDFLKGMRYFAKRNLLQFDTRDINRSNLTVRDLKSVAKSTSSYTSGDAPTSVTEGKLYGTSRTSTQDFGPVRMLVRHSEKVDEEISGARARKIDAIFIETDQGERFRMPFKKLSAGRAMSQHLAHGGYVHDQFGQYIIEMVNEMNNLAFFVRSTRNRVFEDDETVSMIEAATERYRTLRSSLKRMGGSRGYQHFAETFEPERNPIDHYDIEELKERFVKKFIDDRMTEALPYVHRAYSQTPPKTNSYVEEFTNWTRQLLEFEDVDIQGVMDLMQNPIEVGLDGMDAINSIKEFIHDDDLLTQIKQLSKEYGSHVDARPLVNQWLTRNGYPSTYIDDFEDIGQELKAEPKKSEVPAVDGIDDSDEIGSIKKLAGV